MRFLILTLATLWAAANPSGPALLGQDDLGVRKCVVKVFSSRRNVNISNPWKRGTVASASGSGVWLGEGRVLTNSHVIAYASQINVQPHESAGRIPAKVVVDCPELDLAIIKLSKTKGLEDVEPLEFQKELPKRRSAVQAYGYPTGGNSLSVTEGIVSRIDYAVYAHGEQGMRIQVDAALNPGNSGGPAIVDGQIAGIVRSRLRKGDNIGYLIPAEEVLMFMKDVEDGTYDGKPRFLEGIQTLQNDSIRERFKLADAITGVLVHSPRKSDDDYPVKRFDVITKIGQHDIDNEGAVRIADGLRVPFTYFVMKLQQENRVPVMIVRGGKEIAVDVPLGKPDPRLVPSLKGRYPDYFVYGPLVFVEVNAEFVEGVEAMTISGTRNAAAAVAMQRRWAFDRNPISTRRYDTPQVNDEQLVMIACGLLPHAISNGYGSPQSKVVASVNDVKITNLKHLVATLRDLEDEYVSFEFQGKNQPVIVFERQAVLNSMEDIMIDNGIPRQGSKEIMKVWDAE